MTDEPEDPDDGEPAGTRPVNGARATAPSTQPTASRRSQLGAGLTIVPPMAVTDPRDAVLVDPQVPEHRRFCGNPDCGGRVGRSRDGRPARVTGYCPSCRHRFSFLPELRAGDVLAGQYKVFGCLAFGGLGWIYLAQDQNVDNRWVAVKGLIHRDDPEVAINERQYLALVQHALIVRIHNFVVHDGAPYIIMEYVGGKSLKAILDERRERNGDNADPLPLDQALAYVVEVLRALQHLHDRGLLYCDFKPENVIHTGDEIKLIDLGAVYPMSVDLTGERAALALYGTAGFQAPEVPTQGPSVASDLYTVARTLAVLTMDFAYRSTHLHSLPSAEDAPLLARHDSYHQLLRKGCAADPDDRFPSADEMRTQVLGVLREVMADIAAEQGTGRPPPIPSQFFGPLAVEGHTLSPEQLPRLLVDPSGDAGAGEVAGSGPRGVAVIVAEAEAWSDAGDLNRARAAIAELRRDHPRDWRSAWLEGVLAQAADDPVTAGEAFSRVLATFPGELAPKLALALAREHAGDHPTAERLYAVCARTDATYAAAAAFGIARVRVARGDDAGAARALEMVAPVERSYVEARRRRAELLARDASSLRDLAAALESVAAVSIETRDELRLRVAVLSAALRVIGDHGPDPYVRIAGASTDERSLRRALEHALRELARVAGRDERMSLVDRANRSRPWTWF
jgi:serine/threonine-protein kinase PknG